MPETKTYTGGCHCGRVRYQATMELKEVMSCNCSICAMHCALWTFIPPAQFTLSAGGEDLRNYQFNRKVIHHLFCSTCGLESFARGKMPDGSEVVAVNVRCLEGVDLDNLKIVKFDGRSL